MQQPRVTQEEPWDDRAGSASFNDDFLTRFVERVPIAHALERALECKLLAGEAFRRPILDLGCGDGIFAKVLFAGPVDVGLDPDPRELEVARSLGVYERLLLKPGDDIPAPDGHFRTVFSNSVLEHISDLPPTLEEVNRVLHSDGRFYVTVPTHRIEELNLGLVVIETLRWLPLTLWWKRIFRRIWNFHTIHTPNDWERVFQAAGFEIERSSEYQSLRMYRVREAVLPASIIGFASKRVANRWVLLPGRLRGLIVSPIAGRLDRFARRRDEGPGCLIFYCLRKRA